MKERVIYMDNFVNAHGVRNLLYRGNEPKITNSTGPFFAYDLLTSYMADSAKSKGISFPSEYWLIDIKLIYPDWPIEWPDIALERNFFVSNPTLGSFATHHVIGDLTPPWMYPSSYVQSYALNLTNWQPDDLPAYIHHIRNLLETGGDNPSPEKIPTVVYFHCECGCDRTGEIAGSYAMRYLNFTFVEANTWDQKVAGRWILPNHKNGMEWYCEYLYFAKNFSKVIPCNTLTL